FGYGVINTYYVFAHFLFLRFDFLVLNQNEGLWIFGYVLLPVFKNGHKKTPFLLLKQKWS
ncbi:hypothetical protein, partial [Ruminococcus bicirculans (ex Wegman et al. 2014)]|uniref:hypothetical protein n=1 Tax=Ruminococcus bicirculans (ex Wegman et al. 2014) TaxID=1160721 RepID=UPI00241D56D3